jgi:Arabinofuranosyltransferase N terminal
MKWPVASDDAHRYAEKGSPSVQLTADSPTREPSGEVAPDAAAEAPKSRWWLNSGWTAFAAWLVATPFAFAAPKLLKLDPISPRGAMAPMLVLALGIAAAAVILLRGRRINDAFIGMLAGLYAAWFSYLGRAMLYGTPFGYEGMEGDAKRIVAMALRYTTTWASSDATAKGRPAVYPPLFPWLVGRFSEVTGVAPYHLIAYAQMIFMSGAILGAFLLWRRLVPAVVALGMSIVMLIGYDAPDKPYEIVVLAVVVPWALLTFTNPPRGRMHWLPAGIIGGLIVLCYSGFLVFAGIGIAYLVWRGLWAASSRRAELRRLGLVALTALVVSSWYVVPYIWSIFALPPLGVWEDYEHYIYAQQPVPMPFLVAEPASILLVIGLAGLVWWGRSLWWARSLSALLIGTYVYYCLAALRFVFTANNMFAHYAGRLVGEILAIAAVLTIYECVRLLLRNFDPVKVRRSAIVLGGVVAMVVTVGYWNWWKPTIVPFVHNPRVSLDVVDLNPADAPLTQPLPDGRLPKYAAKDARKLWLPVWQIRDEVAQRYGKDYKATVITQDERVYAYLPWYAYLPAAVFTGPQVTTDQLVSAAKDGKIDAFILKVGTDRRWWWMNRAFEPQQFDAASFDVVHLENDWVLVIRKPS